MPDRKPGTFLYYAKTGLAYEIIRKRPSRQVVPRHPSVYDCWVVSSDSPDDWYGGYIGQEMVYIGTNRADVMVLTLAELTALRLEGKVKGVFTRAMMQEDRP